MNFPRRSTYEVLTAAAIFVGVLIIINRTRRKDPKYSRKSEESSQSAVAACIDGNVGNFIAAAEEIFLGINTSSCSDILLIPRDHFLNMMKFERNDKCLSFLMNYFAAKKSEPEMKILFVCHRWQSSGIPEGNKNEHYNTTVAFVKEHPDISHVFVDYSCISQQQISSKGYSRPIRAGHLRSLPLAILNSEYVLLLPKRDGRKSIRYSDLNECLNRGWIQLELMLASLMKRKIFIHFQFGDESRIFEMSQDQNEDLSVMTSEATTLLMVEGEHEVANDSTHENVLRNWISAGETDISYLELLSAAVKDFELLDAQKAKHLLTTPTFDAIAAPTAEQLLGDVALEEDRPEILRLLLFAGGCFKNHLL